MGRKSIEGAASGLAGNTFAVFQGNVALRGGTGDIVSGSADTIDIVDNVGGVANDLEVSVGSEILLRRRLATLTGGCI